MDRNERSLFTVIVNTYPRENRQEDLINCLDSLKRQKYKKFSIVLVENNDSLAEVNQIMDKYGEMKIETIFCPVKKLSKLFNIGWKATKSKYLAFLADDAVADIDWLGCIAKELKQDSKIGAVSGPVVSSCFPTGEMHALYLKMNANLLGKLLIWPYMFFAMDNLPSAPGKYFSSGAYSFGTALPDSVNYERQEIDLLTTTSMGIKRNILEKLKGFDEDFSFNHADGDLFLRIKKLGYKLIFSPKVKVKHMVRIGPSRNAYFIGKDTGIFHRKHLRPRDLKSFVGAIMNVVVLNSYWIYSAIKNKDMSQLKGIVGYIEGVGRRLK